MNRHQALPWARPVVASLTADLCGLVLIAVAWYGASAKVRVSDQLAWIVLGVTGLTLAAVGNAGHLFVARLRVRENRRAFEGEATGSALTAGAATAAALPVAGPVMTRYHRPDCWLVKGKPVESAESAVHARAGRRPCGVCQP